MPETDPAQPLAAVSDDPQDYLEAGHYLDSNHPDVQRYAARVTTGASDARHRAIALFYAVRDGLRYDPYTFSFESKDYLASRVLTRTRSFCVPKAVLLAAAARACAIPARLGFADVVNHLSGERLRALMRTEIFAFHGYAELFVEGRWLKATPAFNRELCEHFGVSPLDFDGRSDAMFQAYEADGRRHMEYIRDRGRFIDLPFETMLAAFDEVYGRGAAPRRQAPDPDFA